jgi:hypothetical protein
MDEGREKVYHREFVYREVRLPGREEPLLLLVVGFRAGADDVVDDGAAQEEQKGSVAAGAGIHREMGHRRNYSLYKAEL